MTVGWFRRLDDDEQDDLEGRISGTPAEPASGRPASLMDALHDRISQVAEVTRAELRLQAAVLDDLLQHIERLEARVAALVERTEARMAALVERAEPTEASAMAGTGAGPSSDVAVHRLEARVEAHAVAVEAGFRRLMAWLDAPAAVVDLRTADGGDRGDDSGRD